MAFLKELQDVFIFDIATDFVCHLIYLSFLAYMISFQYIKYANDGKRYIHFPFLRPSAI